MKLPLNADPEVPNMIEAYAHCILCLTELDNVNDERKKLGRKLHSPGTYARYDFGITQKGEFQVFCRRHKKNVLVAELAKPLIDIPCSVCGEVGDACAKHSEIKS